MVMWTVESYAVIKAQGSLYCGLYFSCQNLATVSCVSNSTNPKPPKMLLPAPPTYSGEIIFATVAATMHVDMTHSFLV